MFIRHTAAEAEVVPIRVTDSQPLPPVSTGHLSGLYQHDLFFYHDRFSALQKFAGDGGHFRVWECVAFCKPLGGEKSKLYLMHRAPPEDEEDPKQRKHIWYLVEMTERDTETPLLYARTKKKGKLQIDADWVDTDPNFTPKKMPIALFSIWDLTWPNRWEAIVGWVVVLGGLVGFTLPVLQGRRQRFLNLR